jgi:hypothetical protein
MKTIIQKLITSNLTQVQIAWLCSEVKSSIPDFKRWAKQGHMPGHPNIPILDTFDAFLFYWKSEFQWCTSEPCWESSYTELEYQWIQNLLNAFPKSEIYSTYLMLNFN